MLTLKYRAIKLIDRLIGGAALTLTARFAGLKSYSDMCDESVSSWSEPPLLASSVKRILVIRPGGIGDAVLTFPMLTALKDHFMDARIDVLVESRNSGVYEINDMVDKIYLYDDIYGAGLWRALRENYDLIVDTEQYHRLSSLIAYATGAANRCGFDNYGKGLFYSHRVKYSDTDYEISSFLSLATCVTGREYNFNAKNPFLFVDVKWQQQADNILYKIEGFPFIVVVPGTQSPTRIWPAERYVDVIQWLLDHDFAVCILGGRDTITAGSFIADKMKHGKVLNLTGKTNIPQTSAILQKARLYLGTDCGVLHIAVGVGTSTVHMFGSGIQGKWAPMGQNYYLVDKKLPCSPCTQYGYTPPCPYNVACMRAISSNDVIQVLEKKFYK